MESPVLTRPSQIVPGTTAARMNAPVFFDGIEFLGSSLDSVPDGRTVLHIFLLFLLYEIGLTALSRSMVSSRV